MKVFDSISTARTVIRRFISSDELKFIEFLCNPEVTENLAFDTKTRTAVGAKDLLKQTLSLYETENPLLAFAIESKATGAFLGVTGLNPLNQNEIEIFYALFPDFWGKGFATEVLEELTKYIFGNTSFITILVFITQDNSASIKVAEKCGFINEGLVRNQKFDNLVFLFKKQK